MKVSYEFLPELFLRAPYYSFNGYDLDRLPEVLAAEAFRNALFLASPDFYRVLEVKGFDFSALGRKERHTLCKYYNRMCFRPVPFGSFASFSLLEWGSGETVMLAGDDGTNIHLLPDEGLLSSLRVGKNAFSDNDLLTVNPVLYRFGNEFRFVKSLIDEKGHYRFSLDALPAGRFYTALFSSLRKKQMKFMELSAWMERRTGCSTIEAKEYIEFLVTEQVLYHTGSGNIINKMDIRDSLPALAGFWTKYQTTAFTQTGLIKTVSDELDLLLNGHHPGGKKVCFYSALERKANSGGLAIQDQEDLLAGIDVLRKLALPFSSAALKQFTEDFKARFDLEKVPLLLALDPDSGVSYGKFGLIGFANGFEDVRFPKKPLKDSPVAWTKVHSWLFRLWSIARENGRFSAVELREADLATLDPVEDMALPPSTLAVMFRKTEDYLLIEHAGGATATALIGRFTAFSTGVGRLCRELVNLEVTADPDVLFADVGQLNDTHSDNINRRELIYPYEIPVNVFSTLPKPAQIPLEDMLVSVRNGELILESVKLKKRIIPRIASVYNYHLNELAIFRLLGDLQFQGLQAFLNFSMESFFPGLNFYPRVAFGQIIISLAKWTFSEPELAVLFNEAMGNLQTRFRRFRDQYQLPQRVSMGSNDQQLIFNLSNSRDMQFFLQCLTGLKNVTISEYLLPDRSVKISNKPLAGQFIAFLSHRNKIYRDVTGVGLPLKTGCQRDFLLGSKWIYLKIYCTPESAESILVNVVAPFIRKKRRMIIAWFFIRYFDNGYHLRLRLLTAEGGALELLADLKDQLNGSGHDQLVKGYQGDIYRRELERYGAGIIEFVEEFFCAGSELVLRNLVLQDKGNGGLTEFHLGLYSAYCLLTVFLGETSAFTEFTEKMADRYFKEFHGDRQLKLDLDLKYRSIKPEIDRLVKNTSLNKSLSPAFKKLLQKAKEIIDALNAGPETDKQKLLADLIHMQLNRTFRVKQRTQEFMVYYFLHKYARSGKSRISKPVHP